MDIFLYLRPSHWIFRNQEDQEDYGIDGEIEVTSDEDKATGFIFKMQLKGTQAVEVDSKGTPRFRGASVERFDYYMNSLSIPTIFVVCDITSEKCYWIQLQGNKPLERAFNSAKEAEQQTFTVVLSNSQVISKDLTNILPVLDAVELSKESIALREFKKLRSSVIYEDIITSSNPEEIEEKHQDAASYAKAAKLRKLIQNGQYELAYTEAKTQFENANVQLQFRIAAGIEMVRAYSLNICGKSASSEMNDAILFKYNVGLQMVRLTKSRSNDDYLKAYALIYARAARLRIVAGKLYAFAQSEAAQRLYPHSMSAPYLMLSRMKLSSHVLHEMTITHKRIIKLIQQSNYKILAESWTEYADASRLVIDAFINLNKHDVANDFTEAILEMFPTCLESIKLEKIHTIASGSVASMVVSYIGLFRLAPAATFAKRMKALEPMIQEFSYLENFQQLEEQIEGFKEFAKREPSNEEPTVEQLRDFIRGRAYELGFQLDNPDDQFAEIINIGLNDLDPTRVLKNCTHMYCVHESGGMPAEMLGLPSAGMKKIVCLKYGHSMGGLKLDDVYKAFAENPFYSDSEIFCDTCDSKEPHAEEWQYTFSWGEAQHQKYMNLRRE